MKEPSLTLGIEEEYQIIDPETRELKSYITEILSGDSMMVAELKPELHHLRRTEPELSIRSPRSRSD